MKKGLGLRRKAVTSWRLIVSNSYLVNLSNKHEIWFQEQMKAVKTTSIMNLLDLETYIIHLLNLFIIVDNTMNIAWNRQFHLT